MKTNKTNEIQRGFLRQMCNLQTYMNAYSFTLRLGLLTEEEFDQLYSIVTKFSNIASTRFYGV